jgi:hypothetical protein
MANHIFVKKLWEGFQITLGAIIAVTMVGIITFLLVAEFSDQWHPPMVPGEEYKLIE